MTYLNTLQIYALYALAGLGCFLLLLWLVVRRRTRKLAAVRAEIERKIAAEVKAEQDRVIQNHVEHVFGRRALYRREMAARELDRYYGKRVKGPDPSYAEWAAAKGFVVTEMDEEMKVS